MIITTKQAGNSYFVNVWEGCVKLNFVTKGGNTLHLSELASAEIFTNETDAQRGGIPAKKYDYLREAGKLRALRFGSGRKVKSEETAIMALVEKALTARVDFRPGGYCYGV